jgi:hypothetical protein
MGSEKTSPDGRTQILRSTDKCRTWERLPSPTAPDEQENPGWGYMMCELHETSPGHLLAAYLRPDRFNPDEPLFHHETSGMQRTVVRLCESEDYGQTWSKPRDLDYVLPDLIAQGPFIKLPNGSLGMPCEVWHEWDKGFREGPSTRLILSDDGGKTWPKAGLIARDKQKQHIYGDPKLTILPDGRIVALLWVYNMHTSEDLPIHRSVSSDMGVTWSAAASTGIIGQRSTPTFLKDDLMMVVYQSRFGQGAGLRAMLSYDEGISWDKDTDTLIWHTGHHTDDTNPFSGYEQYTFGFSSVWPLSDQQVLVTFWVSNGKTTYIRVLKVAVG